MANTYTQIHIQAVFAVRYRIGLIRNQWKGELFKYITGILQEYDHKMLAINGMPDHIHLFFGMRPTQGLSELIQKIKSGSSGWINDNRFVRSRFEWQEGFGGFSYSKSQVYNVIRYIRNQEAHHKKKNFLEEYRGMLKEFNIEFDERYIFKELE